MKKQSFYTSSPKDMEHLMQFIAQVPMDKRLEWSVEEAKSSRSAQQNRLFHMWVGIIARDTGNSVNGIKMYFSREFLKPEIVEVKGEITEVIRSTTTLKVDEMTEYLKQIDAFASEHGIYLPHPEDMHLERKRA